MKFGTREIRQHAAEILEGALVGLRFSDLCKGIQERGPETNMNTIRSTVVAVIAENPDTIARPSRGVVILKKFLGQSGEPASEETPAEISDTETVVPPGQTARLNEAMFYQLLRKLRLAVAGGRSISSLHVVACGAGFRVEVGNARRDRRVQARA